LSRILLAWAPTGGFGHLAPFVSLTPRVLASHALHVALRKIAVACRAAGDLPSIVRAFARRNPDTAVGTIAGPVVARVGALAAGHQERCE
jgi:hypothetical protein